jgi:dihydroorotate dehydrogenase electron transfer subunit
LSFSLDLKEGRVPKFEERARIIDHEPVAEATYRLGLECPKMAVSARPGQFAMLQVREGFEPLLRRPFSFHRIRPEAGRIDILYRVAGRGTSLLSQAVPGHVLSLVGPLGNGFGIPSKLEGPVAVLAGGIGIAPLWALMDGLITVSQNAGADRVHLFYGACTSSEMLPLETFLDLKATVHWSTDDGSCGYCGFSIDLFRDVLDREGWKPSVLYACGPLAMQHRVALWALEHGIQAELSLESLMACGIGACLGCALPAPSPPESHEDHYIHVCRNGPVFRPGAIQWNKIPLPQTPPPICLSSWDL